MTPGDAASLKLARWSGCCGDGSWRGRLCSQHQAWADGYDQALDDLEAARGALVEAGDRS